MSLEAYANSLAIDADDVTGSFGEAAPLRPAAALDYVRGGGYGQRRGASPAAIAVTVAVHVVLAAALLQLGAHYIRQDKPRIVAMDLSPAPPPPAPAQPQPPTPPQQAVAEIPPIILPRDTPVQVAVAQDITPVPMQVTVTPPAPAAQAPAPAASPAAAAAAAPAPRTVNLGDIGAQMVSGRPPRYPTESRRKHEQGTVVLFLTLGTDGRVANISVSRSSGFARLDDAAMDAVKRWRWAPPTREGQPVIAQGVVEIPFQLQERA